MRSIIFILAALLPLTAHAQLTADIKAAWHFDEASGNALDAKLQERRVVFEAVESERGRKAYNVRPAGD